MWSLALGIKDTTYDMKDILKQTPDGHREVATRLEATAEEAEVEDRFIDIKVGS